MGRGHLLKLWPPPPKWFEAITCSIWLRLEYRPLGSACFFGTQLWYFQPRGPFLDPQIWVWVPAGPGLLFWAKKGAWKT